MSDSDGSTTFAERCAARARARDVVASRFGCDVTSVAPSDLLWVSEAVASGIGVVSRSPIQVLAETREPGAVVRAVLLAPHLLIATVRDRGADPALVIGFDDLSPVNATCQAWFYARRSLSPDQTSETLEAFVAYTRSNWNLRIVYLSLPHYLPAKVRASVTRLGTVEGTLPQTAFARGGLWDEDIVAIR